MKDFSIEDVALTLKEYFADNNMHYKPIVIAPASNHPDDKHLFQVVAEQTDVPGKYTVWTSWNMDFKSLNHGHYGFDNMQDAMIVIEEHFYDARNASSHPDFEFVDDDEISSFSSEVYNSDKPRISDAEADDLKNAIFCKAAELREAAGKNNKLAGQERPSREER